MRIPRLMWNRRHNIAALTVSYSKRIWHTREVGELILGYNATGRLARVVILDPRRLFPPGADVRVAVTTVVSALLRAGDVRPADLDVLRSALERATSPSRLRATS
ncbi:MAG: hypothetical protein ACRDKJ_09760 [Actinomycetota bacterium]